MFQVVTVGQTLWVKVMEVDPEEKKMTVSCSLDSVGWGLDTMATCVRTMLEDQARSAAWTQHKVGLKTTFDVKTVKIFDTRTVDIDQSDHMNILTKQNMLHECIDQSESLTLVY